MIYCQSSECTREDPKGRNVDFHELCGNNKKKTSDNMSLPVVCTTESRGISIEDRYLR